jgi:hypothetical protein
MSLACSPAHEIRTKELFRYLQLFYFNFDINLILADTIVICSPELYNENAVMITRFKDICKAEKLIIEQESIYGYNGIYHKNN